MKVLFVCTGNTCRSPMAEALLQNKMPHIHVKSAGLFSSKGNRANDHSLTVLQERDITFSHQSQPVTDKLLQWADLVLTMTIQHKQMLILEYPHALDKIYTLKEYTSSENERQWGNLHKAYANLEKKRSSFIREHELTLDQATLEKKLSEHLATDIHHLRQIELMLNHYDISDPFGGDIDVYRQTIAELDEHVEHLRFKLTKQMEEEES